MITVTINGKEYSVKEGVTIIDAARANNIDIPPWVMIPVSAPPAM